MSAEPRAQVLGPARSWTRRFPIPAPIEAVYLVCGAVLVLLYAWWMDDAFVYFRYVDNLLFLDVGLVYNAGEYVEGYSSPLWILLLITLRALELGWPLIVHGVGLLSFAAFGLLLVALNRSLAGDGPVTNLPLAMASASYGVSCYFTSGLETPLVQVSAAAFALFVVRPGSPALGAVLGLAPLLRHELLLPLAVAAVWARWRTGRLPRALISAAAVALGGWFVVRVVYYAELLPNTFHLKHGAHAGQGWIYLWDTLATYRLIPLALIALVGLVALHRARARTGAGERAVMLLAALTVTAYVVRIGGDARHYRYLAFPFCLAIAALAGLPEALLARFAPARHRRWASVGLGLAAFGFAFTAVPPQLDRHPLRRNVQHQIVRGISDAEGHRSDESLAPSAWEDRATPAAMRAYREQTVPFTYRRTVSKAWCAEAYRLFDRRVVQSFGLTDPFLARTDPPVFPEDRPGHKHGLIPLSLDLVALEEEHAVLDADLFRAAVERGEAPEWIEHNLPSIEAIARKVYNRHSLAENLRLAFTFPSRIAP